MTFAIWLVRAAALAIGVLAGSASAHEGDDHGAQARSSLTAGTLPRLEAVSGPFELVAVLQKGELVVYLDRFDSNAPIMGASVTVETPAGPATATGTDGAYHLPAPWAKPGSHNLIFTVGSGNLVEVLTGTLVVATETTAAPRNGWSLLQPAFGQGLSDVLASGWILLVLLMAFGAGRLTARLRRPQAKAVLIVAAAAALAGMAAAANAHEGDRHEANQGAARPTSETAQRLADGSLFVPKPVQRILAIRTAISETSTHRKGIELPGRIIPDPGASGFVQASVSGRLSPPEGGFPKLGALVKAGDVLALVTPPFQAIDVSDMRQRAGELEQQIGIVEKRVARYEALAKTGAVSQVSLDEALVELKGLRERRAALDRVRSEPERLIAPVSGVIAAANAVSGQIAETNAIVFQIIDPARLWVEALTFSHPPDARTATARTGDGRKLALALQGAGLTDRSQAIPVHFAIEGNTKGLRIGQLLTVLAPTGEEAQGLAVPRSSILRAANGHTILFEHAAPERFASRIVRVEPLDAERVLVLDGLQPGKRVVVQGAELLNQVR